MIVQNDFKRQWQQVEHVVLSAVKRVGASGRHILGEEVERSDEALARTWGLDTWKIGLRCLDLRADEKILTTPLSAFPTILTIIRVSVLVFVDLAGGTCSRT